MHPYDVLIPSVFALILLLILVILWRVGWPSGKPQKIRRQMDRFSRRQRLVVTPVNGGLLARALAISRRWRRFGLVCGLLVSVGVSLPRALSVNFNILFLGWFVGAVIAEWRIASLPIAGTRRVAELTRRSLASYITRSNRVALALSLIVLAGFTIYGVFVAPVLADHPMPWSFLAVLAVAAAVLRLTFGRVTSRPQPFVDDDARQADDALRGHSLTILAGCVIATAGWLGNWILNNTALAVIGFPLLVVSALAGWWVASWSASARAKALQPAPNAEPGGAS